MKSKSAPASRRIKSTVTLGATALCAANSQAAIVVNNFNQTVVNTAFRFTYDSEIQSIQSVGASGTSMMVQFYQGKSSYFGSWNSVLYVPTTSTVAAGGSIGSSSTWAGSNVSTGFNLTDAYYGIRVNQGSGNYNYGWAKFTTTPTSATLKAVAFETDINTPILAGATTAVPEPSTSLLGLAGGAVALLGIRRRSAA